MAETPDTHADRREAILQAAVRAFARHGYAATTIEEIASEAGISKGSVYNYFPSKEALFFEIFQQVVSEGVEGLECIVRSGGTATEKILKSLDFWLEQIHQCYDLARLILECWTSAAASHGDAEGDGQLAAKLSQMYQQFHALVAEMLREGVESGEFRLRMEPDWHVRMILGLLDGLKVQSLLGVLAGIDPACLAAVKQTVLDSLGADASSAGEAREKALS